MPIESLTDSRELSELFDDWLSEQSVEDYGIRTDKEIGMRNFQLFCDNDNTDVLVSRNGRDITGMLVMVCAPSVIGPDIMGSEQFFYVRPKWRGLAGIRLIKAGEQWARDRECTHLIMSSSKPAGELFGKVCMLYEKLGMIHIEAGYIKQL